MSPLLLALGLFARDARANPENPAQPPLDEETRNALAAFRHQYLPQADAQVCVTIGEPAEAIVAYGGSTEGRLIVMPTHGYGPFRRMLEREEAVDGLLEAVPAG